MSAIPPGSTIGILGGGQLGRMTALAAASMGYDVHIYCPVQDSPAFHVSRYHTQKPYDDEKALESFAKNVSVVTFEFENVPAFVPNLLSRYVPVRPNGKVLRIAQNRLLEKSFARECGVATAPFVEVGHLKSDLGAIGFPALLKTAELGYDGKGQVLIESMSQAEGIQTASPSILEAFVPFQAEVSSIAARSPDGTVMAFPTVENVHEKGILRSTYAPARLDPAVALKAQEITVRLANQLEVVGLLSVEYFVTEQGDLLFNEMAPRPHNSGHWTLDGCETSQFEQLVRAVCGLPLGSAKIHTPIEMQNLLGEECLEWEEILQNTHAKLHLYGKEKIAAGRKMGHINHCLKQFCPQIDFS